MNNSHRPITPRPRAIPGPALAGLALLALLASPAAFAYLDPSTGSMVVSAIVGIFASIALAVKTYWYKIKGFFRRGGTPGDKQLGNQDISSRERPE
jgi:hypothetical protein